MALSVSPFAEHVFDSGAVLSTGSKTARSPAELQGLFRDVGATEVFARIATNRAHVPWLPDGSLARGLERAQLAMSLGLHFNPELGLFRRYGDVRCQPAPDFSEYEGLAPESKWETLSSDAMAAIVRAYAAEVAREIRATGADAPVWDLGNEIDFGVAGVAPRPMDCDDDLGGPGWYRAPDGVDPEIGKKSVAELVQMRDVERIAWLSAHVWPHESKILAAAAAGVRTSFPAARFSTHIATFSSEAFAIAFYGAMREGGFAIDEPGFSFYPTLGTRIESLESFRTVVDSVARTFGPVFIAEFSYPASGTPDHALAGYPISESGQASLFAELRRWGDAGRLSGLRPWAPELVSILYWEPHALFRPDGTARPALDALRDSLASTAAPPLRGP